MSPMIHRTPEEVIAFLLLEPANAGMLEVLRALLVKANEQTQCQYRREDWRQRLRYLLMCLEIGFRDYMLTSMERVAALLGSSTILDPILRRGMMSIQWDGVFEKVLVEEIAALLKSEQGWRED